MKWVNVPDFSQNSSFQPPPSSSSCIEKAAEKQLALIREWMLGNKVNLWQDLSLPCVWMTAKRSSCIQCSNQTQASGNWSAIPVILIHPSGSTHTHTHTTLSHVYALLGVVKINYIGNLEKSHWLMETFHKPQQEFDRLLFSPWSNYTCSTHLCRC